MLGMGPPNETTGVIVIRLWREPDHPRELRARISAVRDVTDKSEESVVASSIEEIVEHVRRFVSAFTAA
jgi:hypothetical protein